MAHLIAPHLRPRFQLRRLDTRGQTAEEDDELVAADARDVDAIRASCEGVSAVLHLAAQPAEADFRRTLLPRNLDATWATYEAAVQAGVRRFLFASTVQAVQGYHRAVRVDSDDPPRPSSVYACTKVFGEALGRYHADVAGLGVACLRLGAVRDHDSGDLREPTLRDLWLGSGDLAELIIAAVGSDVPFALVLAVSPPATERFDTSNPFGWVPVEKPTVPA